MNKVCLTTYIYGDRYQDYIPWILYSVGRAYPDYFIMLFINGELRSDLKPLIELIKENINPKFRIVEHTFDDCPKMNPIKAMSLRWVLWDEQFRYFDYIYIIDADMFYIREPIPLHEQHIRHMKYIGSDCISNVIREKKVGIGYKNRYLTYGNFKYGGLKCVLKQLFVKKVRRFTGLHFVKVSIYYKYLTREKREYYKQQIYSNRGLRNLAFYDNEHFLYQLLKEIGVDVCKFAIQQTSTSMFGFNLPERAEFRPHHGIHMGVFRIPLDNLMQNETNMLDSDDYQYYIKQLKNNYLDDKLFNYLLQQSSSRIKLTFERMYSYYSLNSDECNNNN